MKKGCIGLLALVLLFASVAALPAAEEARSPGRTGRSGSPSTKVFQPPHSGQRPSQRGLCASHAVQVKTRPGRLAIRRR